MDVANSEGGFKSWLGLQIYRCSTPSMSPPQNPTQQFRADFVRQIGGYVVVADTTGGSGSPELVMETPPYTTVPAKNFPIKLNTFSRAVGQVYDLVVESVDGGPKYKFKVKDFPNLCIDVPDANYVNNKPLMGAGCNTNAAQFWAQPGGDLGTSPWGRRLVQWYNWKDAPPATAGSDPEAGRFCVDLPFAAYAKDKVLQLFSCKDQWTGVTTPIAQRPHQWTLVRL